MLVKNRYGGVQTLPDHIARELIKAGTMTEVAPVKPAKPEPKPKKPAKSEEE